MNKEEYDKLNSDEKIEFHRRDIELDNSILKLDSSALLQAEYEIQGAMSIVFQYWNYEEPNENDLEYAQSRYWAFFVETGWMPNPLKRFCEPNSDASEFNAAGSISGAFIEIARVRINLPRELTEL